MTAPRPETLDAVEERLEKLDLLERALELVKAKKEERPTESIPSTAQDKATTGKTNPPGSYGELWGIYNEALWNLYLTEDEETVLSHGRRYCRQWMRIRLGDQLAPGPMYAEAHRIIKRAVQRRRAA